MLRYLLPALALTACGADYAKPKDPAGAWLYDRGAAGPELERCLRLAATMRAECNGDAPCEQTVSEKLSFHCYVGNYRGNNTGHSVCRAELTSNEAIHATCVGAHLAPALVPHCEAELHFYRDDLCRRGDTTLTGSGP